MASPWCWAGPAQGCWNSSVHSLPHFRPSGKPPCWSPLLRVPLSPLRLHWGLLIRFSGSPLPTAWFTLYNLAFKALQIRCLQTFLQPLPFALQPQVMSFPTTPGSSSKFPPQSLCYDLPPTWNTTSPFSPLL